MATACDHGIQIWDLDSRQELFRFYAFEQGGRPVQTLALSPDGQTLATADLNASGGADGEDATRIRLWALKENSSDPIAALQGHSGDITQLAFSEDGRHLVSRGFSQTAAQAIIIWDWQTGQIITQLDSDVILPGGVLPPFGLGSQQTAHLLAAPVTTGELLQMPLAEVVRDIWIPRAGAASAYAFAEGGITLAWAGQPPTFANPVVHLFGPESLNLSLGIETSSELPSDRQNYRELSLAQTFTYPIDGPLNTFFGPDPEQVALLGLVPPELIGSTNPEDPEIKVETLESTADKPVVMITLLGLPDDSVANRRYRVEFAPYGADGLWKVTWAGEQTQCRPTRGHQIWSAGLCG